MIDFDISQDVLGLGLIGAYFVIEGLLVKNSDPGVDAYLSGVVNDALKTLSDEAIDNDPVLEGFRELHRKAHVSERKNASASENLLRFVLKKGGISRINTAVDVYNAVSITSRLALGAHDLKNISGNVHLRLTTGKENFIPIGAPAPKQIASGEYAYVDDANDILCRLEVRQVEKTKVTAETKDCFYIVQGNAAVDAQYIKKTTDELIYLTKKFCGGREKILYAPWLD
jgi:DNA/RNA-binding domain of Phe-tRNA-synthetase-like protein